MPPPDDPTPRLSYRGELARKGLHLLALIIPTGMLLLPVRTGLLILVPLALLAVAVDLVRERSGPLARWVARCFGFMMRPDEIGAGRTERFNGATWVMVTAAVLLVVFPAPIAAAAMAMAMIGDAAAAVVGIPLGRHPWPGSGRTVEGTVAFVVGGLLAGLLFTYLTWPAKLTAVGVTAVAELVPIGLNDNFVLPMVCGAVLFAMSL